MATFFRDLARQKLGGLTPTTMDYGYTSHLLVELHPQ